MAIRNLRYIETNRFGEEQSRTKDCIIPSMIIPPYIISL